MTYYMLIENKTSDEMAQFDRDLTAVPGAPPANRGMSELMSVFGMPTR